MHEHIHGENADKVPIAWKELEQTAEEPFSNIDKEYLMIKEENVTESVFELQKVTKEVPYVSFDSDGNEVTLYRTVESDEKVKVGETVNSKKVVDYNIINNLGYYCYDKLAEILAEVFGEYNIKKV